MLADNSRDGLEGDPTITKLAGTAELTGARGGSRCGGIPVTGLVPRLLSEHRHINPQEAQTLLRAVASATLPKGAADGG